MLPACARRPLPPTIADALRSNRPGEPGTGTARIYGRRYRERRGMDSKLGGRGLGAAAVCAIAAIAAIAFSLPATAALAAPANDDFADALAFGEIPPGSFFASSAGASKQPGEPDHAGDSGGASVWYSWTPAMRRPGRDQHLRLSNSTPCSRSTKGPRSTRLTPVAGNDDRARGDSGGIDVAPLTARSVRGRSPAGPTASLSTARAGRAGSSSSGWPARRATTSSRAPRRSPPRPGLRQWHHPARRQGSPASPTTPAMPAAPTRSGTRGPRAVTGPIRIASCSVDSFQDPVIAAYIGTPRSMP